jgi:hypothetical protein
MSPRDFYWFMAGSLVTLTAAFTLRGAPAPASPAPLPAFATNTPAATQLDATDLRAAELISQSTADSDAGHSAGSLEEVTARLAARLAAAGGTPDEWRLLAQSYEYLGRAQEAQNARARAAP